MTVAGRADATLLSLTSLQAPGPYWRSAARGLVVLTVVLLSVRGVERGWAQGAQVLDGIAAIVNDEIITISEVREAVALDVEQLQQRYSGAMLQEQRTTLYRQALEQLIAVQLQLIRARALRLEVGDKEVANQIAALKKENQLSDEQLEQMLKSRGMTLEIYRQRVREGLLVSKVMNVEVRSRLVVLENELRERYEREGDRYRIPAELTVSHILFLVPQHASAAEVEALHQKAAAVLQEIQQGGDFATLAARYSAGPSAEVGGRLGTFRRGELLPGFEEAAAALQPGEISGVVRSRVGFHIIRLEAKKEGERKPFEAVREEIRSEFLRQRTEDRYREWLESLRQQAYIKILFEG